MINWLSTHWQDILAVYGGLVALCTAIVKITPSDKDDKILAKVVKFADLFSTVFTKEDKAILDSKKEPEKKNAK